MMISGAARRRQQTITHDALGRAIRADEMNWDGTIYRTLRTTFNARDQVTEVRQEGTSASARVSTIGYDGHGRVSSEQRPEQTQATSYLYYPDDTVQQVTDARGATANFLYNARHLVTQVSYTTPNATVIPNTPSVNYTYDAAGNRLSMTDGLGSVSYGYDSLSRLASETRQFTGVPRAHQLSYQYNLAGGLTRVTDPDAAQVNYQHDRVGQVTGVTGAGAGSAPVYVASVQYRAWGAARRVTYGNNVYADVEYNTRLQPTRFEVRRASGENPTIMLSTYQYHADGRIRFASNEQDHTFDRAYLFDHVGRLQEAYTAGEARNFRDNLAGGTTEGAYRQSYAHDEWDNLTSRVGRFWSGFDSFTQSVTGRNQNPNYFYDAAGNLTQDEHRSYRWDAAGRMVYSQAVMDATRHLTPSYDGDGRRVKRVGLNAAGGMETSFYVTSSVLGGRVVTETTPQGEGGMRYAYLGGEVVAEYGVGDARWQHRDPVTGSRGMTQTNGLGWTERESDPMGVDVGFVDPFVFGGGGTIEPEIPTFVPNEFGSGDCTLDGMPLDCARVEQLLGSGGAEPCRNNDCGPQAIYSRSQGRFIGLTTSFMAFANGVSGYFLPSGEGETPQAQADAYARRVSGRSGGIDSPRSGSSGIFGFVNMFMPQQRSELSDERRRAEERGRAEARERARRARPTPLSDCVKSRLAPYFPGMDLSNIRTVIGIPSYVTAFQNARAYTEGNTIYFREDAYDSHTVEGLALMGHEIKHVQQTRQLGQVTFSAMYLAHYGRNLHVLGDHGLAYEFIPFEREAERLETVIRNDLTNLSREFGGRDPCPR